MRKSGLAAATGIASLVLLLAACGGSSGSGSGPASSGSSGPAAAASSATAVATATTNGGSTASAPPTHLAPAPRASGDQVSFPPVGTTIMVVQKSAVGYVLAEANNQVVYTYAKDSKGGAPTCTGSCAAAWPAVTGLPKAGPADTLPGPLGTVTMPNGAKQVTYNGYPLYTFKGAGALSTKGNGLDGEWHVIKMSASNVATTG
jgi:predicted lipoprotein with Yx(FWY)xxD motif